VIDDPITYENYEMPEHNRAQCGMGGSGGLLCERCWIEEWERQQRWDDEQLRLQLTRDARATRLRDLARRNPAAGRLLRALDMDAAELVDALKPLLADEIAGIALQVTQGVCDGH
jgi:hypothetical protein